MEGEVGGEDHFSCSAVLSRSTALSTIHLIDSFDSLGRVVDHNGEQVGRTAVEKE